MGSGPSSRHFEIQRVAPGVHAAIATRTGFGLCNSAIIDLGGVTVVFDTMLTPMAGRDLARAAERLTGEKPTWVVNSHYHGDHIWGNSQFVASHVVSSRRVRDAVLERSHRQWSDDRRSYPQGLQALEGPDSSVGRVDRPQVRAWFRGVLSAPRALRIVAPEVVFEDELVLHGRRRSLRLLTYGKAHSPADVFGYLPDERILLTGDLALKGYHPSLGDGYPSAWVDVLEKMRRLRVETVLPGHGPLAGGRTVEWNLGYHRALRSAVARAVRRGVPGSKIAELPVPPPYGGLRFSFMYPENLRRVYRELRVRRRRRSRS